jgi:hypothetical protein
MVQVLSKRPLQQQLDQPFLRCMGASCIVPLPAG